MEELKTPRGYDEDFDPEWFLDHYYKTLDNQIQHGGMVPFALDFLHDTFSSGCYKGDTLLDLGTGPTVHSVISASRHVNEIHLSDISARCRDILHRWRAGEPNNVEAFEYITRKEHDGMTVDELVNSVRQKVTDVFNVDLRLADPLPGSSNRYDIVVSSLVICAVARNKSEFTDTLRKVIAMIKPGGYLVVIGVQNSEWYRVGDFRFSGHDIDRGDMKRLFLQEHMKILEWRETDADKYNRGYGTPGISKEEGVFGVIAQKPASG